MTYHQRYLLNPKNKIKAKKAHRKWYLKNIKRVAKKNKAYKQKHLKRLNKILRDYTLKLLYGITLEQYNELFKKQKRKCAICKKSQFKFKRKFAVDHDHKIGKVRGLLCMACNLKLATLENIKFVKLANKYLKKGNK